MEKYYTVLEIPSSSSFREVRQAYLDLVKVWHPDRFTHDLGLQKKAEEKLKGINEAYTEIVKCIGDKPEVEKIKEKPIDKHLHEWICPTFTFKVTERTFWTRVYERMCLWDIKRFLINKIKHYYRHKIKE